MELCFKTNEWEVEKADIVTAENVRDYNTFDCPEKIKDTPFKVDDLQSICIPAHSVLRICLKKQA